MAHKEATFRNQHSAVSEGQNQPQNQKAFTAEDAEDAKENKENQRQNQRPFTTQGTEDTHPNEPRPGSLGAPGTEKVNAHEQVQQRATALALKLARTYEELTRLLERNPGVKREITEGSTKEDKVYQKLKHRLKMADMAPRCQWVRQDGTSCRSPQMKQHIYCFAHMQMAEARELMLRLPPPEDANAIQVGLMRIQKAVTEDTISMKKAGLLLYSMQLALTNVGQTTFGQAKDEEMVRETVDEDEAFSEKQNQHQHQRPFTTEGTEDTEEEKSLPRMDADERRLENPKPIVWKPTPDMYRMDTPEGREAYEATFGTKIRTSGELEATPPRAAVPHEHAEVPNSSLRDERLPKGPRFANEPLDADTGLGSVFQTAPYANLG